MSTNHLILVSISLIFFIFLVGDSMINIENACCFTGYRPEKFDFPFSKEDKQYCTLIHRLCTGVADMLEKGCTVFYTGMAMGFDILAAEHIITLKLARKDIKLIAVVPFSGQEKGWPKEWQDRYREVLAECDETVVLNDRYTRWVYSKRNRYMVDRSRFVLTYFDGKEGGTKNTLNYAVKCGREVLNIYETDPVGEIVKHFYPKYILIPPEN